MKLIKQFFIWRLWLFLPLLLAVYLIPFRENSLFTTIWQSAEMYFPVESPLVFPWSNFDGVHYLGIASRGYIADGRFLPLFPILIRFLIFPVGLVWKISPYGFAVFMSGFFLSNLFFIFSLHYLKKLLLLDLDKKIVYKTILLILVFPTSFFFVSIYTESLFLLLSLMTLYFSRKKEWYKAIFTASLLTITRLPGILIMIPLSYEFMFGEGGFSLNSSKISEKFTPERISQYLKFLLIPIPLLLYTIFNYYKWGDPFYFVNAHSALGNSRETSSLVFPAVTFYRYLKIFLNVSARQYEFWIAALEFGSFIFVAIGLVLAYIKKVRPSYLLFSLSILSLPILSGTLTGFPRYLLLAFPIFIGFALYFNKIKSNNKINGYKIFILASLILQFFLLMLFSRGWFVA